MIMYVNSEDGIYTAYPWLITQRYTGKPETECEDLFIKSLFLERRNELCGNLLYK